MSDTPVATGNSVQPGIFAQMWRYRRAAFIASAIVLLAVCALMVGQVKIGPETLWHALTGNASSQDQTVLWQIRLPRILAALLVGGALAGAGACFQALFRNPLVSPDILGVSAGAGLGAVIGIFLALSPQVIHLSAFAGGLVSVAAVIAVARLVRGADRVLTLVLTGIIVGALAGALTALTKTVADPYSQLPAMTFWLMGSLASVAPHDLPVPALMVTAGLLTLWLWRWRIDVLTTGDDTARALGLAAGRDRIIVIAAATLVTASVTALAGLIGWVGLVIPHMARLWVGPATRELLPAAVGLGAAYLLIVDTIARSLLSVEIPIGILTALIGAPFFVALLARSQLRWGR